MFTCLNTTQESESHDRLIRVRVDPDSLSYPFPLVVRVHVRVRANSGFDRGVGVSGRGRYPLKPSIYTSLLETKEYQNTLRPDHPESIFVLNNLFKTTTVLFCALHSPVTYIYICNHALNWNVLKNRYFSTLTLHCWFAQQSRVSLTRENITKTHDKHTLLDGEFVIKHTLLDGEFVIKHTLLDGEFVIKHTLLDGEFVIKHTLLDGEFVINTCLLWWRSSS